MTEQSWARIEQALAVHDAKADLLGANLERLQERQLELLARLEKSIALLVTPVGNNAMIKWLVLAVILASLGAKSIDILLAAIKP